MCAVFAFITMAWATFSDTLQIRGSATVKAVKWAVEFTDTIDTSYKSASSGVALTGTPKSGTSATVPSTGQLTIQPGGLTVSGVIGTLGVEGDEIVYSWYVQNFGNFNADITSTDLTGANINLDCESGTNTDEDAWCAANLTAQVYFESASATTYGSNPLTASGGANDTISLPAATNATSDNTDVKKVFLVVKYTGSNGTDANEVSANEIRVTVNADFSATQNGAMVTTTASS